MIDAENRTEYVQQLAQEALAIHDLSAASPNEDVPVSGQVSPSAQPQEPVLLKTWKPRTLADAYTPRPPLEYLVERILAAETLSIVFGAPGSLKSMLLADLAICIAAESPWLPPMNSKVGGIATKHVPVLWVDLDNGARRSDERFEALGKARGVPRHVPLKYYSMPSPWFDASSEKLMQDVAELVQFYGAKLVVIDNLGAIVGSVNENDSGMASVMGNLRRLCEQTGAAVVVIHHQRKSTGSNVRKGETLRGHSSIEAALDLALQVSRKEGADEIVVTPTKMRGATFPAFGAEFAYSHHSNGTELEKACFYGMEIDNPGSDDEIDDAMIEVTREFSELNKGTLKKEVKAKLPKAGINRIGKRIDLLVSNGRLASRKAKEGSTEVLIRLP